MEKFNHSIPIRTERLILRPPTLDDLNTLHRSMVAMWPELQQWMSWAYDGEETIEATEAYIRSRMNYQTYAGLGLVGFDRSGNLVISTGLSAVEGKPDDYETGYWVDQAFQGQGYATEATNAVIRYAFSCLKAKAVHINYFADNIRSKRVIEKLGFRYVETKLEHHKRCSDGMMVDSHDYIMTDPSKLPPLDVQWG